MRQMICGNFQTSRFLPVHVERLVKLRRKEDCVTEVRPGAFRLVKTRAREFGPHW